jgi:flavin reductase (DIM6/NTAB) family NADH-FMN oxidoreductase RutF
MAKTDVDLAKAYRLIEPGPVVLVTAQYRGERNVMTAAWVAPAASTPPLVALVVYPANYTHDLIVKGGDFVLNIPARPLAEQAHRAATVSGRNVDKCIAHIECGVIARYDTGDHSLFIGEIVAASAEQTAFDGEMWTCADESVTPFQHLGKNTYALMKEKFVVKKTKVE